MMGEYTRTVLDVNAKGTEGGGVDLIITVGDARRLFPDGSYNSYDEVFHLDLETMQKLRSRLGRETA